MSDLSALIARINTYIINPAIGVLFAVAFMFFLWGMAKFIFQADDDHEREQGKKHIIWGLVGMFIMVSVYGIIAIVTNTFGIPSSPSSLPSDQPFTTGPI